MSIERIVQIHIAALSCVGAMLLGVGHDDSPMPVLVLFAAVASLIFTDVLNWFRLNRIVANSAALLALFVSYSDFLQTDYQRQLLAIANLLIYLQLVLFFQRKSQRIYWQLAILSLLQVVVAAALNVRFEFGVLLMLYTITAISALSFFFVHRETRRVADDNSASQGRSGLSAVRRSETNSIWQRFFALPPNARAETSGSRLASQLVSWGLVQNIFSLAAATVLFTIVLFFASPRLNSATSEASRNRSKSLVGFSNEVSLAEFGEVLQNEQPVMTVKFSDFEKDENYHVLGQPYWRGAVMTQYRVDNGVAKWRQRFATGRSRLPKLDPRRVRLPDWPAEFHGYCRPLPKPPRSDSLVLQKVVLQPIDESVLFATFPAYGVRRTPKDVCVDVRTRQLIRDTSLQEKPSGEYPYVLVTTCFRGGLQLDVTPHCNQLVDQNDRMALEQELAELVRIAEHRFPRLKQIADEIASEQIRSGANRATICRALRNFFDRPGLFQYTLDFRSVPRDPSLDPIEDFVANHRSGHCEYFASALTMMLRSQGIPARLVVGYRGGQYNTVGGYFQIRQSHAHAWVEAYLPAEDAAAELPPNSDLSNGGGWLRLDPTPGANAEAIEAPDQSLVGRMDDALDYAQLLWSDYIMGLTAKRQRESIYKPVAENADLEGWAGFVQNLSERREALWAWLTENLINARNLVIVAMAVLLFIGMFVRTKSQNTNSPRIDALVKRLTGRLTGRKANSTKSAATSRSVAFYQRLEQAFASIQVNRFPGATPQEFIATAVTHFDPDQQPALSNALSTIVMAYYRIRFGEDELDSAENAKVDQALAKLEAAIAPPSQ